MLRPRADAVGRARFLVFFQKLLRAAGNRTLKIPIDTDRIRTFAQSLPQTVGQASWPVVFQHTMLGKESRRSALVMRAVERNAISGFSLSSIRDLADDRNAGRLTCRQQSWPAFRNHCAVVGKERTPDTERIDCRTGRWRFRHVPIHHAAMMFAIAAAAGGQVRFGVSKQRGRDQREAE